MMSRVPSSVGPWST